MDIIPLEALCNVKCHDCISSSIKQARLGQAVYVTCLYDADNKFKENFVKI